MSLQYTKMRHSLGSWKCSTPVTPFRLFVSNLTVASFDATQSIFWVDIEGKRFFSRRCRFVDGVIASEDPTQSFELPERPGSFCLCADGRLLFAFENGPAFYDPVSGHDSLQRICGFEEDIPLGPFPKDPSRMASTRMNDGRVDPFGNFVVGGYDEVPPSEPGADPRSAIYRIDGQTLAIEKIVPACQCSNAICFSADGATMYYTDSLRSPRRIWRTEMYRGEGGAARNPVPSAWSEASVAVRWSEQEEAGGGLPDGSVVDVAGNLWSAQFGRGRVVRYDAAGEVDFEVQLPGAADTHPTCLAFGGPDLRTIFITMCGMALSDSARAALPPGHAGGLFVAHLPEGVPGGRPEDKFGQRR